MYPKAKGACIVCGGEGELYQQPESSGFRNWCRPCHEGYRVLVDGLKGETVDAKTLFLEIMAFRRQHPVTHS